MENSYSKVRNTKAFKILDHIGASPFTGRSFSEIQEFIVTLNGLDWNERATLYPWAPGLRTHAKQSARKYRGYYCTILLGGMHYHQGLLHTYCVKLPNGRWMLTEDIYGRNNLNYQHGDPRSNTKTYDFNVALRRGRWEKWRDDRGDKAREYTGR